MKKEKYKSGEKALTKGDVEKLLASITDIRDLALFQLAITCGLRREDIVNVRKGDIDFASGKLSFVERKKGGRIHTVYVPEKVLNTIKMVLNAFPKERESRLFPICGKTAWTRFQMYLERAGLERRPFHALRATCIKLCQANKWSSEQTASHVNDRVQTIQEHYLTPSQDEMAALAKEKVTI